MQQKKNLGYKKNLCFINGDANNSGLELNSQDFGYCLGVLHHIPDTQGALNACVKLLKPGAPFLVYIYYFFEDKNFNFQGTPVYFEPITSVLNLKRMNDVCRHAPSLGKYTNQILGWRNGVHTKFDDSDDDEAEVVFIKTESGKKEQNNNRNNEVEASVNNNSNNNDNIMMITMIIAI